MRFFTSIAAVLTAVSAMTFSFPVSGAEIRLERMAGSGDINAQLNLAHNYFFGRDGYVRNMDLAFYWYGRAAHGGSGEGLYNLGVCYEQGWGPELPSAAKAYELYRRAEEVGVKEAGMRAAMLLFVGVPEGSDETKKVFPAVAADPERALRELEALDDAGFYPAGECFAELIWADKTQFSARDREAFRRLSRAAGNLSDPAPHVLLAEFLKSGFGCAASPARAAEELERAATLGSVRARAELGLMLIDGDGVGKNFDRALELLRPAAADGDPAAQNRLGELILYDGLDGGDPVAAVKLFSAAEKQNYLPAAVRLGRCCELGVGTAQNLNRAVELYNKAARGGLADGQFHMGRALLAGLDGEADIAGACYWLRSAANQRHPEAMREYGKLLVQGKGLTQDIETGTLLIQAAAAVGDSEALLLINSQ